MRKLYFIVVLAGIAIFIFMRGGNQSNERLTPALQSSVIPVSILETQINSEGAVTIKITPKLSFENAFEVALDTHSEELDADLIQAVIFRDENGKEYSPMRWEGDSPGGHHRGGTLIFDSAVPISGTIQLIVLKIGGIAERKFLWTTRP